MADTKKPNPDSDTEAESSDTVADPVPEKESLEDESEVLVDSEEDESPELVMESGEPDQQDVSHERESPEGNAIPAPVSAEKKSGFASALIGGVLAAVLGIFAARTEVLDSFLPGGSAKSETASALADLKANDTKQSDALTALRTQLDAIDMPDLAPVNMQLSTLKEEIAGLKSGMDAQQVALRNLESQLSPIVTRLEALEKRPMTDGASKEAMAAYDRELAALQQSIAAQRKDVESMIDNARATEAAARELEANAKNAAISAQNQAALARLLSALENGEAYAPILAELTAAGVSVPTALNATANDGVPTLTFLSDAFPAAAREALSAARADGGGGLGSFLQRQLGARSVQPKQGDDPDAILSRAEAAVTAGDLSKALLEIKSLPDNARAEMKNWVDSANTRLTALQAAEQLAQSLNTN